MLMEPGMLAQGITQGMKPGHDPGIRHFLQLKKLDKRHGFPALIPSCRISWFTFIVYEQGKDDAMWE